MDDAVRRALDSLVNCWSNWELSERFYLDTLLPDIVDRGVDALSLEGERRAVAVLRSALPPEEWQRLPALVRDHRLGMLAQRRDVRRSHQVGAHIKAERDAERKRLRTDTEQQLQMHYLGAKDWFQREAGGQLAAREFDEIRTSFVQSWCTEHLRVRLDEQQASAVAE